MNKKAKIAEWQGYAMAFVDEAVKKEVKARDLKPADFIQWIEKVTLDGYKFSVSWDENNQCYQVSLFARLVGMPNEGLMLSLRHVDLATAITTAMVLHEDVYSQSWHTRPSFDW